MHSVEKSTAKVVLAGALKSLPKVTHGSEDRPLRIGDIEIPCYVLEGPIRVITQNGALTGLGMSRGGGSESGGERLAGFAGGKGISPFISKELSDGISSPIVFVPPHGGRAFGYPATILVDICDAILAARAAGALHARAAHIAARAEALICGFARVGITALVDEATGYQADRAQFELRRFRAYWERTDGPAIDAHLSRSRGGPGRHLWQGFRPNYGAVLGRITILISRPDDGRATSLRGSAASTRHYRHSGDDPLAKPPARGAPRLVVRQGRFALFLLFGGL